MSGTENNAPAPKRSKRRWFGWLLLGVIGGAVVQYYEPRIYRASTSILIIPQRVPARFVEHTVTASLSERLNMILQQILLAHAARANHPGVQPLRARAGPDAHGRCHRKDAVPDQREHREAARRRRAGLVFLRLIRRHRSAHRDARDRARSHLSLFRRTSRTGHYSPTKPTSSSRANSRSMRRRLNETEARLAAKGRGAVPSWHDGRARSPLGSLQAAPREERSREDGRESRAADRSASSSKSSRAHDCRKSPSHRGCSRTWRSARSRDWPPESSSRSRPSSGAAGERRAPRRRNERAPSAPPAVAHWSGRLKAAPTKEMSSSLFDSVSAVFSDGGMLADTLPGFEPRDGQRRMAEAVARCSTRAARC